MREEPWRGGEHPRRFSPVIEPAPKCLGLIPDRCVFSHGHAGECATVAPEPARPLFRTRRPDSDGEDGYHGDGDT